MSVTIVKVTPTIPTVDPFQVDLASLNWVENPAWVPMKYAVIYPTGVPVKLTTVDTSNFSNTQIASTQNCNAALI